MPKSVLLARLAKIGARDGSALNKGNLMMPDDPYQLAYGYAIGESHAVRQHLLGAPWTRLVNEGYLVDYNGQGFFTVTDEVREFLASEEKTAPVQAVLQLPPRTPGVPRALLSYSWEGDSHQLWVLQLAEQLRQDGIDVLLDQWYLTPGGDRLHFMEQGVRESDFVVVICTPTYAGKANGREGGVGYESMVITGELAQQILMKKFIPVLRSGAWTDSLPTYLQSKLGVDLSGAPYSPAQYEQLLRVLHGEPIQPPPIGKKPVFGNKLGLAGSDATGIANQTAEGSGQGVLGPANKRPNAIVYTIYEKKGFDVPRESAHIRFWDRDGGLYSFENSRGKEHLGTKREVVDFNPSIWT